MVRFNRLHSSGIPQNRRSARAVVRRYRYLRRAAAIAAQYRVGRVVAVNRKADEADRGEAPVALAILVQPQMADLAAGAAAQGEDLMRACRQRPETLG